MVKVGRPCLRRPPPPPLGDRYWCPSGSTNATAAPCVSGQFSTGGAAVCIVCPGGQYNNAPAMSTCTSCVAGYATLGGSTPCAACLPGTFNTAAASAICATCTCCSCWRRTNSLHGNATLSVAVCRCCPIPAAECTLVAYALLVAQALLGSTALDWQLPAHCAVPAPTIHFHPKGTARLARLDSELAQRTLAEIAVISTQHRATPDAPRCSFFFVSQVLPGQHHRVCRMPAWAVQHRSQHPVSTLRRWPVRCNYGPGYGLVHGQLHSGPRVSSGFHERHRHHVCPRKVQLDRGRVLHCLPCRSLRQLIWTDLRRLYGWLLSGLHLSRGVYQRHGVHLSRWHVFPWWRYCVHQLLRGTVWRSGWTADCGMLGQLQRGLHLRCRVHVTHRSCLPARVLLLVRGVGLYCMSCRLVWQHLQPAHCVVHSSLPRGSLRGDVWSSHRQL